MTADFVAPERVGQSMRGKNVEEPEGNLHRMEYKTTFAFWGMGRSATARH